MPISNAVDGRRRPHSVESRAKMGRPGRRMSAVSRDRMSTSRTRSLFGPPRPEWGSSDRRRFRLLGITPERFSALIGEQGGVCAICQRPETVVNHRTGIVQSLSLDHDHRTNKPRGALCVGCNRRVGIFEADAERVLAYLERYV